MDKKRNSTANLPAKECRYAENCYRKNPAHFSEYSHSHLQEIFEKGLNLNGEFEVPDQFSSSKFVILEQLKILEDLYPTKKQEPPKKVQKIRELFGTSSEDEITVKTEDKMKQTTNKKNSAEANSSKSAVIVKPEPKETTKSSTAKMEDPKVKSPKKLDSNTSKVEVSEAKSPKFEFKNPVKASEASSPKSIPKNSEKDNKTLNQDKQQRISSNIKDFFKERAQNESKKYQAVKKEASTSSPSSSASTSKSNLERKQEMNIDLDKFFPVKPQKGQMAKRLKNSAPYNFFLTTVTAAKETHNEPLSITFQDLLDDSLGCLESSVQINFMVDIGWLYANYCNTGNGDRPMLILYGDESPELRVIQTKKPNITAVRVQINTPYGVHHTKMMIFEYTDKSIRLVISTANLYEDDWHNRVQGLWISERLPQLPENASFSDGESRTGFREDLLRYLVTYNLPKLQPYIAKIRKTDFSSVNVFFVASTPGSHREIPNKGPPFGHPRLGKLLSQHSAPVDQNCPIVAQCSSIGNLGPNSQSYLLSELAISFRKDTAPLGIRKVPQLKLVYPSFSNVKSSFDGMIGGGCLPYAKAAHDRQMWLNNHLCQWKAGTRNRNRSMPHIKCYGRWSDEGLYWFCLTSANMSKSAWGTFNKGAKLEPILRINSYEAGVLFAPRIMIGKNCFPMNSSQQQGGDPIFPMPYDVPLTSYKSDDTPFCMDYLHEYLKTYNK